MSGTPWREAHRKTELVAHVEWAKLLQECQRATRWGGVIRFTEVDFATGISSPALRHYTHISLQVLYRAGRYFTAEGDGVISQLADMVHRHGVRNVQTRAYMLDYRTSTALEHCFAEDIRLGYRTVLPFLRKWTRLPDDYEMIYQQALVEIQPPDVVATLEILIVWGIHLTCGRETQFSR